MNRLTSLLCYCGVRRSSPRLVRTSNDIHPCQHMLEWSGQQGCWCRRHHIFMEPVPGLQWPPSAFRVLGGALAHSYQPSTCREHHTCILIAREGIEVEYYSFRRRQHNRMGAVVRMLIRVLLSRRNRTIYRTRRRSSSHQNAPVSPHIVSAES
jgi:hypothetical protein